MDRARLIGAVALAVAMVVIPSSTAVARAAPVPTARIQGAFTIDIRAIESVGVWQGLVVGGPHGRRTYTFKPRCKTGGCETVLTRTASQGATFTDVLKPVATDPNTYTGTTKILTDCHLDDGTVLPNSTERTNLMTVHVTKRNVANTAMALSLDLSATYRNLDTRCHASHEIDKGVSTVATAAECKALGVPVATGPHSLGTTVGHRLVGRLPAASPKGSPLRWVFGAHDFSAKANAFVWDGRGAFAITPTTTGARVFSYQVVDVSGCPSAPKKVSVNAH